MIEPAGNEKVPPGCEALEFGRHTYGCDPAKPLAKGQRAAVWAPCSDFGSNPEVQDVPSASVGALQPTIGKVHVAPAAQIVVEFRGRMRTRRNEEDIANGSKEGSTTSDTASLLLRTSRRGTPAPCQRTMLDPHSYPILSLCCTEDGRVQA